MFQMSANHDSITEGPSNTFSCMNNSNAWFKVPQEEIIQ